MGEIHKKFTLTIKWMTQDKVREKYRSYRDHIFIPLEYCNTNCDSWICARLCLFDFCCKLIIAIIAPYDLCETARSHFVVLVIMFHD